MVKIGKLVLIPAIFSILVGFSRQEEGYMDYLLSWLPVTVDKIYGVRCNSDYWKPKNLTKLKIYSVNTLPNL